MRALNKTTIEKVAQLCKDADSITCVNGLDNVVESGGVDLASVDEFYRIEREYEYSPDEMLSAGMYNAKKERFFDFYKKEIIGSENSPSSTYRALAKLQKTGKLKSVISVNIDGMEYRCGLRNVIEINGSVYTNLCPICKKGFTKQYMRSAKAVPICPQCEAAIRPGIRLEGERVQNDILTEACNACAAADVLLVLGTNLYEPDVKYCTGHYKGDKMILISHEEHFMDKYADYILYDNIQDVIPQIVTMITSKKKVQ